MKILNNFILLGFAIILTSCSSMQPSNPPVVVENQTSTPEEIPVWLTVPVTDAKTGQSFTINDLQGKVVLVEGMATWCPTCWKQGLEIKTLIDSLDKTDDLVVVSLALDKEEDAEALNEYAKIGGFEWVFVTSTTPMFRDIGNRYGATYLDPTLSPILVVDKKGNIQNFRKGLIKFDELESIIKPLLDES